MDPTTGVLALAGLSLAGLLGMKYKKNEEGFTVLNGPGTGDYDTSIAESQTRYNKFSGMINPLVNAVIPLGSDAATVEQQRQKVNQALGNVEATFSKDKVQTLALKEVANKNIPRAEGKRSLFGAMQFCREAAAKSDKPFSVRDPTTNAIIKPSEKSAEKNADGTPIWDFDEVCGICLTKGIDEEGKVFDQPRGLLLDPTAKQTANEERARRGLPYPRTKPALATCEGAPRMPVFATNDTDLTRFKRRLKCQHSTSVGAPDNCAICFEHNTRSYVPLKDDPKTGELAAETQVINLNLQGVGKATVFLTGRTIAQINLDKNKNQVVPLTDAVEGQEFGVAVERPNRNTIPQLYGYIESTTPRGGRFRMPLNLILIKDKMAGGDAPNRSFGFYRYARFNLISAIMGPATGKTGMSLVGLVPFTFVQPDDFAALDCPSAPFQASADTIRDYAKDQPCFTKDAKPGEYSTACLQELILSAGCTSQGTLYNNPQELNGTKRRKNDLARIYKILEDIKDNDMVDAQKTMKCSGRKLARPCDPFLSRTDLKFLPLLMDNRNSEMKDNAAKCLAMIYNNAGASEADSNLGPTYSGLVTYKNDQRERKNIYCLPEGKLNPEKSTEAMMSLARIADQGYDNVYSVEAVKKYLNDQLELAADWRYNANKDSGRKTAIANCFGKNLSEIPQLKSQDPTMLEDVCGILAKFIRIRPKSGTGSVGVSQIVAVDSKGNNVAVGQDTSLSSAPKDLASAATAAVDGILAVRSGALPQYLSKPNTANVQFIVNLGVPKDITKVIFYGANTPPYNTAKAGLVVELLDENQKVLAARDSTSSMIDKFDFLLPEADPTTCKTELIVKPVVAPTPTGYVDGLFGRFYQITNDNPGTAFGSLGWGDKIGDSGVYTDIAVSTDQINTGAFALMVRGYFIVNEPQILYLQAESANGVVITLNSVQVVNNWNNATSVRVNSNPLYLQQKGLYPFQAAFLRKTSGRLGNFFKLSYKMNDETDWKTGLKGTFAYNTNEEQLLDEQWQQELRRREEAARAAAAAAALAARNAKIADFQSQLAVVKNTVLSLYQQGVALYNEAEQFSQNLNIDGVRSNLVKLREIYTRTWDNIEKVDSIYASILNYDRSLNTTFDPIVADIKSYYNGPQGLSAYLGKMNTLVGTTQTRIEEAERAKAVKTIIDKAKSMITAAVNLRDQFKSYFDRAKTSKYPDIDSLYSFMNTNVTSGSGLALRENWDKNRNDLRSVDSTKLSELDALKPQFDALMSEMRSLTEQVKVIRDNLYAKWLDDTRDQRVADMIAKGEVVVGTQWWNPDTKFYFKRVPNTSGITNFKRVNVDTKTQGANALLENLDPRNYPGGFSMYKYGKDCGCFYGDVAPNDYYDSYVYTPYEKL